MQKLKGNITSGYRLIRDGSEYNRFFPKPNDRDRIIIKDGEVEDTVELMKKVVWKYIDDTKSIANYLKRNTVEETCSNIWSFLYNHIQYRLDQKGLEQLRRPARSWQERKSGIDCDCFSIFISSILTQLKIPHKFRITKYDKDIYQHVYVVVPIGNGIYAIDPVLSQANYEKPYKQKKDFTMSLNGINVAVLDGSGLSGDLIHDLITGAFDGLGNSPDSDKELQFLIQTRKQIAENPLQIATVENPVYFIQMLDYAIKYWNTPNKEKALEVLIQNEDSLNIQNGYNPDSLSALDDANYLDNLENDWSCLDNLSNAEIGEYLDTIEEGHDLFDSEMDRLYGLGFLGKSKKQARQQKRQERKEARQEKKQERKEVKQQKKDIKAQPKGAARKQAMKDFRKENKRGFFRTIGKGVKAAVRYNPLSIAARNGFLLAMKLNLFKMAERIKWAYATDEQARGKITPDRHKKAKDALAKIEKLFADRLQGKREALKNAILKGKSGGLNGFPDNTFSGLGEPASSALIAAASAVVAAVVKILGQSGLKNPDDPTDEGIEAALKSYDVPERDAQYAREFITKPNMPGSQQTDDDDDDGGSGGNKLWTFIKNNPMVAVGGLVGLAGVGYLLFKGRKKAKALSGVKKTNSPKKVECIKLS